LFKFRLTGSTELSNKLIERKEKEDLYGLATSDPWQIMNPVGVTERLLKAYGETNTDELIKPEVNQIIQAINEIPQAKEMFMEVLQEAMQLAQQTEQEGKQIAQV